MFSFGVDVAQPATKVLPPPPHSSVVDEETHKCNTDCIYFLASPLTCKKGTSCEYRHSEAARMNSRDCRFWKAGSCLNPRCSFRHLPFEEKSVSPAAVPSNFATPIVSQLGAATVPSSKSKTPCYFFSQGCCTKNDKCPFMHVVAMASCADAISNTAVSGIGKRWQKSERLPHSLKESAPLNKKPVLDGSHISKVAIAPQAISQGSTRLERPHAPEKKETFTAATLSGERMEHVVHNERLYCTEQSQLKMEGLQGLINANKCAVGSVQSAESSQTDVSQDNFAVSNSSLDHTALNSDGHQNANSLSNSTTSSEHDGASSQGLPEEDVAPPCSLFSGGCDTFSKHVMDLEAYHFETAGKCKRQRKDLAEQGPSIDDCGHLVKQRNPSNQYSLPGKLKTGQQKDLGFGGGDRGWIPEKWPKGAKDNKASVQIATVRKIPNMDKPLKQDNRQRGSIRGLSNQETKSFRGPKSLAQIKAEKMAAGKAPLETIARQNLSKVTSEAGKTTAAARKISKTAEIAQIASEPPVSSVCSIKSVQNKQENMQSLEFEGPKSLSFLLKRKRELHSRSNALETNSAILKSEAAIVEDSNRELEDGEVVGDDKDHHEDIEPSCYSVLAQGDSQPTSLSPEEGVHRAVAEATDFDLDSTEGLNSDIEMDDAECVEADGNFDFGMDDDEDDEEDFATKLGRVFALSSD